VRFSSLVTLANAVTGALMTLSTRVLPTRRVPTRQPAAISE
jgi:hypothetical protein